MKLYTAPVGKGQVIHWFYKLQDMYRSYKKCSLDTTKNDNFFCLLSIIK